MIPKQTALPRGFLKEPVPQRAVRRISQLQTPKVELFLLPILLRIILATASYVREQVCFLTHLWLGLMLPPGLRIASLPAGALSPIWRQQYFATTRAVRLRWEPQAVGELSGRSRN